MMLMVGVVQQDLWVCDKDTCIKPLDSIANRIVEDFVDFTFGSSHSSSDNLILVYTKEEISLGLFMSVLLLLGRAMGNVFCNASRLLLHIQRVYKGNRWHRSFKSVKHSLLNHVSLNELKKMD